MTADEAYEGAFVLLHGLASDRVTLIPAILTGEISGSDGEVYLRLAWVRSQGSNRWYRSGGGWYADHRTQLHPDQDGMLAEFTAWRLMHGE